MAKDTRPLDAATVAEGLAWARAHRATWQAELAGFIAERDVELGKANTEKDETLKAAKLAVANNVRAAAIGRHTAIVGALDELEGRYNQIATYLTHKAD